MVAVPRQLMIVAILGMTLGTPRMQGSVALAAEASAEPKISERLTDPQAKHHYELANRYFDGGRYELAAQQLGLTYAIEPLAELLLQRALVLDAAGRCEEGLPLLEDFLASGPSPNKKARAAFMLEDCRKRRGLSAPAVEERARAEENEEEENEEENEDEREDGARPWLRDPAGGALLGVGLAAMLSGGGLLIASTGAQRSAQMSALHSEYALSFRRATLLQSFGGAALVAGAALTIGALLRYGRARRASKGDVAGGPWLGRGALGLSLAGRF